MFERLTHRDSKGDVWIKDAAHVDEQGQICMLSERLAQYEDIGLTPDEITDMIYRFEAFLYEMTGNRMSKSNYTLDAMISAANDYQQSLCDGCWDRSELAKYYELEHEKRLVVLPCKIGEKVYRYCNDAINEGTIINILLNVKTGEIGLEYEMPTCYTCSRSGTLGKNLFLTREAAEKALGGGGMNECKCCCVASKYLGVYENADPRIFITVSGAYLQIFDEEYLGFCDNHKINFCPICGRKLS